MNIYLTSALHYHIQSHRESILPPMASKPRIVLAIAAVALVALAILTAAYLLYRHFLKHSSIISSTSTIPAPSSKDTLSLEDLKKYFTPLDPSKPEAAGLPQPGLNVEGICRNETCEKFNQLVVIPQGLGPEVIDMGEACSKTYCPSCKSKTDFDDVNTMVLDSCQFHITARNSKNEKIDDTFKVLPTQVLRLDIRQWKYIELKIAKL